MREVVSRCDVCGEPGAQTYTIREDDSEELVEIELDELHARPLRKLMAKGRARRILVPVEQQSSSTKPLVSRIRGVPGLGADE